MLTDFLGSDGPGMGSSSISQDFLGSDGPGMGSSSKANGVSN